MTGHISALFTYPIKSLSGQPLRGVRLEAGHGFPDDRRYGFARHDTPFDEEHPEPFPKARFLTLMRDEQLAGVRSRLESDGITLHLDLGSGPSTFDLSEATQRAQVAALVSERVGLSGGDMARLVSSASHCFTDVSVVSEEMMHSISILNRASLEEVSARARVFLAPARFRANVIVDGWPPFFERDLVNRSISIGDVKLTVLMETKRCAATAVDPETAQRDANVVELLREHTGQPILGVYARVDSPGDISIGDAVVGPPSTTR